MIDRWGRPIFIGWAEHEMIWIQSAMTLDHGDRLAAYQDIASMTGRTFTAVKAKVAAIRAENRSLRAKADAEILLKRTVVVPARTTLGPAPYCGIRQPTKAQLMGRR